MPVRRCVFRFIPSSFPSSNAVSQFVRKTVGVASARYPIEFRSQQSDRDPIVRRASRSRSDRIRFSVVPSRYARTSQAPRPREKYAARWSYIPPHSRFFPVARRASAVPRAEGIGVDIKNFPRISLDSLPPAAIRHLPLPFAFELHRSYFLSLSLSLFYILLLARTVKQDYSDMQNACGRFSFTMLVPAEGRRPREAAD